MQNKLIIIIGGTGFVGRYVVELLASQGYQLRIIARDIDSALALKTYGDVGQIALVSGDITQPTSLFGKLDKSYAVVNLAGVMFEGGKQKFETVHAKGAGKLAELAKLAGAERFIHISAIAADSASRSAYARTKAAGEQAVKAAFPEATILRPGIIFGAEDKFINKFASMAALSPVVPLIGGGKTKFQPVYVGDVAGAVLVALEMSKTAGQTYELGGPEIYSFREIIEFICKTLNRKPCLVGVPFALASLLGAVFSLLPSPPLTGDQVKLLQHDDVVRQGAKTLEDLGILAEALPNEVPYYIQRLSRRLA